MTLELWGLSRAVSFWQYQIHQEKYALIIIAVWSLYLTCGSSFQQAVLRNLNDKIAVLQKQLDNVVREGTSFAAFFCPSHLSEI